MSTARSLQHDLEELRGQLEKGSLQRAYRALLAYMTGLRNQLAKKHGDSAVSALYQGTMDMTYFALFPPSLKPRGLKVAIVFNYDAFRFEAWLCGRNRKIQNEYWKLFKEGQWADLRVVTPAEGIDSIVERDLATEFDLSHPDALTAKIEKGTKALTDTVEEFLSKRRC